MKVPVPELMPSALAAHLLCVSTNMLGLWRRRKAFLPLVILPTGQARYSKFQIMSFSPEAVHCVAKSILWNTSPGHEKRARRRHAAFESIWNAYPVLQELYPRNGGPNPKFTH